MPPQHYSHKGHGAGRGSLDLSTYLWGWGDRRKRSEELSRVLKGPVASPSWGEEEEGWGSVRLLSPLRTWL